jgi:peptide chain release factor 2
LETLFDLPGKKFRINEIESMSGETDFWDDRNKAQSILKEQASLNDSVRSWQQLNNDLDDVEILLELSKEESDEELRAEARQKYHEILEAVEKFEFKKVLGDIDDIRNAIVSINSGAGGTEAQDWADMLFRMYLRYAEGNGFKTQILDLQDGDEAGIKSATIIVDGEYAYGYMKGESGVHRLVRISPFDSNKRRHTSFASVYVTPEVDDSIEINIDDKDLRVDTFRASGKGGQHVNKTDSAIRITHMPTGIVASCQNERSQHQNRANAMKILKAKLYELEREKQKDLLDEKNATKMEIGWGSQIRSYVLHPYRMVKDHRTNFEDSNVDAVLDGKLEKLIKSYLLFNSSENQV